MHRWVPPCSAGGRERGDPPPTFKPPYFRADILGGGAVLGRPRAGHAQTGRPGKSARVGQPTLSQRVVAQPDKWSRKDRFSLRDMGVVPLSFPFEGLPPHAST